MTLDHIPVSLGPLACPKRTNSSSDPLRVRWHIAERILCRIRFTQLGANSCESVKSVSPSFVNPLLTNSSLLYLETENYFALHRRKYLISQFSHSPLYRLYRFVPGPARSKFVQIREGMR